MINFITVKKCCSCQLTALKDSCNPFLLVRSFRFWPRLDCGRADSTSQVWPLGWLCYGEIITDTNKNKHSELYYRRMIWSALYFLCCFEAPKRQEIWLYYFIIPGDKLGLRHRLVCQWEIESHFIRDPVVDAVSYESRWWPKSPNFICQNPAIGSCIVSNSPPSFRSGREGDALLVSHVIATGRVLLKDRLNFSIFGLPES